jgi:hypothetical protein
MAQQPSASTTSPTMVNVNHAGTGAPPLLRHNRFFFAIAPMRA